MLNDCMYVADVGQVPDVYNISIPKAASVP